MQSLDDLVSFELVGSIAVCLGPLLSVERTFISVRFHNADTVTQKVLYLFLYLYLYLHEADYFSTSSSSTISSDSSDSFSSSMPCAFSVSSSSLSSFFDSRCFCFFC